MSKVSWVYALARLARDFEVLLSGNSGKIGKRIINKIIGRGLVRRLWWK